jgi:hypothetical protein
LHVIGRYFRAHPWQRRLLGALLVLILAGLAGVIALPIWRDYRAIELLASDDPKTLTGVMQTLYTRAKENPATIDRLCRSLDTPDDEQFRRIVQMLRWLQQWNTDRVDPIWRDRLDQLDLAALCPAETSTRPTDGTDIEVVRQLLYNITATRRDNLYTRRALAVTAHAPVAAIRADSTMLAAILEDDHTLGVLLADDDPAVVASAALDAGLAGRTALTKPIADTLFRAAPQYQALLARLEGSKTKPASPASAPAPDPTYAPATTTAPSTQAASAPTTEPSAESAQADPQRQRLDHLRSVVSNCALALALLDGPTYSSMLATMVLDCPDGPLRERLLLVLATLDSDDARDALTRLIHTARWEGHIAPAMTMTIAARLQTAAAAYMAAETLRASTDPQQRVLQSQAIAAIDLAAALRLPCRRAVYDMFDQLWSPEQPILCRRLARMLGTQISQPQGEDDDAPTPQQCRTLLRHAAQFSLTPPNESLPPITTPLPSAAAAVALWLDEPTTREFLTATSAPSDEPGANYTELSVQPTTTFYLRETIALGETAPADYVAWAIGTSGRPEVDALGRSFLPADDEGLPPEYNPQVRSAGAMILALSARGTAQQAAVLQRILDCRSRENHPAWGSMTCAALVAGDDRVRESVRQLFWLPDFSTGRAVRALLIAGDGWVLDQMLLNVNWPDEEIIDLILLQGLDGMMARVAPALPSPSAAASTETRLWQVSLMRHTWAVRRDAIGLGLGK